MPEITNVFPGIRRWENSHGAIVVEVLYKADPHKALGPEEFIPEQNMMMSPWLLSEYRGMQDKALFRQEYLIDFEATQGARVFYMEDEATLVRSKDVGPIPHEWTRWYGLDPHPRVPHAHLWCAVDPYGDRWYYREFWPSKMYGKRGAVPEDDTRMKIKEHATIVHYLESADNPENCGKQERVYRRVIDYAARAFGQGTVDDEPQLNFQERYEKVSLEIGREHGDNWRMTFVDCVKDHAAGIELVNDGLKPLWAEGPKGEIRRSRIHILEDKCPELVLQIKTNRYPQLSPVQAAVRDPLSEPLQLRRHMTDNLRYIEMDRPRFIPKLSMKDDFEPIHAGVNY